jgi:putative ABC transport system permease protein
MRWTHRLARLYQVLFRRAALEKDLDAEVSAYFDMLVERHVARGLTPEAARRAARVALEGPEQVKEKVRDARPGAMLESFLRDVRGAFRAIAHNPGFAAAAIVTLALGIGANSAIFSVIDGVLLRPLPYADAGRVAMVNVSFTPQNLPRGPLCLGDFLDWRAGSRSFEKPAAFGPDSMTLAAMPGSPSRAEQVFSAMVTAGFFSTLGATPKLGRIFTAGDDRPGAPKIAILSEVLWRRRFAADPGVVGKQVTSDGGIFGGETYTVVGVMPASFAFPSGTEIWTILPLDPPNRRGPFFLSGVARLKPGVTFDQARGELEGIAASIEKTYPGSYSRLRFVVDPLQESIVEDIRPALLLLFGSVAVVLLIALVNVANLLLTRSAARQREIAIRLSLGATPGGIVRQLLTESLVLAMIGAVAGLLLAYAAVRALLVAAPAQLPRLSEVAIDGRVLAFTMVLSIVCAVAFGLAPGLVSSREDWSGAMKEGGRGGTESRARRRGRSVLVVAEMALSFILLIGAGLLVRSFLALESVQAGFRAAPERVLTMRLAPAKSGPANPKKIAEFYQEVLTRVRSLPGVDAAALSTALPPDQIPFTDSFQVEGQPDSEARNNPAVPVPWISPGYFRTLEIPLRQGRDFTENDTPDSPGVTIISESLARRYFPGQNPIGRRLKHGGPASGNPFMKIVGVAADVTYAGLESASLPVYYEPASQTQPQWRSLVVSASLPAKSLVPGIRTNIEAIDRNVVITHVRTMSELLAESIAEPRFRTLLVGSFAMLALVLASIGIYGVAAYSVERRTQEIGVRVALGAQRGDVLRLVVGHSLAMGALGMTIGLGGAVVFARLLRTFLFRVSAADPITFVLMGVVVLTVALAASLVPALRAARLDPALTLRAE